MTIVLNGRLYRLSLLPLENMSMPLSHDLAGKGHKWDVSG